MKLSRHCAQSSQGIFKRSKYLKFHDKHIFTSDIGIYCMRDAFSDQVANGEECFAIFILLCKLFDSIRANAPRENVDTIAREFVIRYELAFPTAAWSAQLHNLLHIGETIERFNGVKNVWTYYFEHFCCSLKDLKQGRRRPSTQISQALGYYQSLVRVFVNSEAVVRDLYYIGPSTDNV